MKEPSIWRALEVDPGGDLLSREDPVPSALEGLTAVFGMGTGVSPPPLPPETLRLVFDLREGCETDLSASGRGLDLLVPVSSTRCRAYTSGLSTLWSTRGLTGLLRGKPHLGVGLALRCFQRLSTPHMATQLLPLARQLVHQRCVHPGPLVLWMAPLKFPTPAMDRDRTVSRRSEPSSRTALIGEQPNPWNLLQLQDAMSRHRGAKPSRRCGLLGKISLLSPG